MGKLPYPTVRGESLDGEEILVYPDGRSPYQGKKGEVRSRWQCYKDIMIPSV